MLSKKYVINNTYLFDPTIKTLFNQSDKSNKIILGNNENDILLTLIERRSEVLSKEALNKSVWRDNGVSVNQSSVVQAISTLRKILKDSTKTPLFILTVPKNGYQFIGSIDEVRESNELATQVTNKEETDPLVFSKNNKKKKIPLFLFAIFGVSMLVFFICTLSISSDKNNSDLVKVDVINNVPIYGLSNQHNIYTGSSVIIEDLKGVIEKYKGYDQLKQIIVNLNSKHHLMINLIYSDSIKNKSYEMIKQYGK